MEYLRQRGIGVRGIFINRYTGNPMEEDNVKMIEGLTGVPILALIPPNANELLLKEGAIQKILQDH